MLSRTGIRASQLATRPLRTASRNFSRTVKRREEQLTRPTDPSTALKGDYDNAFNRERQAVKQHAAETAGFWRKLSLYVVIPALIITGANTWVQWNEHWAHQAHEPPVSERPQYSYMNIRTKAYPWGDGDKTLFWNDKYNYHQKGEGE